MIVYSVGSRPSFEMVRLIKDKILNHLVSSQATRLSQHHANITRQGADEVPIMLVGNKSDIRETSRVVSFDEGEALAKELKCGWTEASARRNENVALSFELMIAQIEKSQDPNEPTGSGKCTIM